jgi:hypothetical protein
MTESELFYTDDKGNMWDKMNHSKKEAMRKSDSLTECIDCINCYCCTSCIGCCNSIDCTNCVHCAKCEQCRKCVKCVSSKHLTDCISIVNRGGLTGHVKVYR